MWWCSDQAKCGACSCPTMSGSWARSCAAHAGDDKRGAMLVMLEPLATIIGRIDDADENPISGAVVRSALLPPGAITQVYPGLPQAKTVGFKFATCQPAAITH